MGCDIHIIIQVLDPITGEYKFVRESINTSRKIHVSEHITFVIPTSTSDGKLLLICSEELSNSLINHNNCKVDECECQYDFNVHFHITRDYNLFNKIANVRSDNESGENMEPRGLPEDSTNVLKHILLENNEDFPFCKCSIDPCDLHSHTYLFDYEINNLNIKDTVGSLELKQLVSRVSENFPGLQSRYIIAFDN